MASLIKKATYHCLLPLRLPLLACLQLRLLPPLQLHLPHRPYPPRQHLQATRNLLCPAHRVRLKHQLLRHRRRTPPLYLPHQMYLLLRRPPMLQLHRKRRQHLQLPPHPRHLLRRLRPHLQLVRTHPCPAHRGLPLPRAFPAHRPPLRHRVAPTHLPLRLRHKQVRLPSQRLQQRTSQQQRSRLQSPPRQRRPLTRVMVASR